MNNELYVGLKLYREVHERGHSPEIKEYTVSRIGRKYIYLLENDRYAVDKESLLYSDPMYSQRNFQLYRSPQEIQDKWEMSNLFRKIKASFNGYYPADLTLEQLRKIDKILNIH